MDHHSSEIERSFRELKDLVEMRPIYHRRPKRVRAHIFVAALAFLLARARQILAALGISDRKPLQTQSSEKNARLVTK